jgi:hypothetical protein
MPHPLLDGSYQRPVRSTSFTVPDSTKGSSVHVPWLPSTFHAAVTFSKWSIVRRSVPTVTASAREPVQRCRLRSQALPRLPRLPWAVYQTAFPAVSYVYQTTMTSSPALATISKPWPERVGSHHIPWRKGERSSTVAAAIAAQAVRVDNNSRRRLVNMALLLRGARRAPPSQGCASDCFELPSGCGKKSRDRSITLAGMKIKP